MTRCDSTPWDRRLVAKRTCRIASDTASKHDCSTFSSNDANLPQELDVRAEEGGDGVPLQEGPQGRFVQQIHPLRLPVRTAEGLQTASTQPMRQL